MDSTTMIRIVAGIVIVFVILAFLVVAIFYIRSLSGALRKCSPASRTMQPGMTWLLLIPLFNYIWNFIVVFALSKSLANEFRARNIPCDSPEPGKNIGLAMCICGVCVIIPFVRYAASLAAFVLWIIYWVKISEFSHMLDASPELPQPQAVQS